MSSEQDKLGPTGQLLNENKGNVLKHGGPYIGTIMQTDDQTYMGRLRVWIPEVSSTDPQNQNGWLTVHYASPFYGVTNIVDPDAPADITNTPQSYGMWFVPPDIGVQVLVMFANLDPSKGYWIGCLPSQLQNHMIPGIAHRGSTTGAAPSLEPVTEYNKNKLKESYTPDTAYADKAVTPGHLVQQTVLETQGLNKDEARGVSTSTVRRETPSNVYGISTPGPVTKRRNASPSAGQDYRTVTGRKGGHQFVMDDGDLEGNNQLVRIRSSNGGQILINDSIGSVYIINQMGTAWIELTNSGRIDVYSKNSTSIHSEKDINITADNNVNILASTSFNLVSPTINIEGVDINVYGKASHRTKTPNYIISADSYSLNTAGGAGGGNASSPGTGIRMNSDKDIEMVATGNLFLQTAANFEQVATGKIILSANGNLALNSKAQLQLNGAAGIYEEALPGAGTITQFTKDVDKDFTSGDTRGDTHPPTSWTGKKNWHEGAADKPSHVLQAQRDSGVVDIPKPFSSGIDVSHVPITPQHEPWPGHEVQFKGGGGGATSAASASPSTNAGAGASAAAGASPSSTSAAGTPAAAPASTPATAPNTVTPPSAPAAATGTPGISSIAPTAVTQAGSAVSAATGAASSASSALSGAANRVTGALSGAVTGAVGAALGRTPAAGTPQTGSNAAPAATSGPAPKPPSNPAEAATALPTVCEPSLPDGAPTTAIGAGYNVKSITTVTTVNGSVDYQLNDTLAGMLKEMKINWKAYSQAMAARLSNGRYEVVNEKGFVGRYQLSPKALNLAAVIGSQPTTKDGISDKSVWSDPTVELYGISSGNNIYSIPGTPQMAPGSLEAFLLDRALQEKMFIDATYMQYSILKKYKAITDATPPDEVAGYLAVTWMAGFGVPKALLTSLSPNQTLSPAEIQANTQGPIGNGLVGLIAWWKIAGNSPLTLPGADPLGKNSYSYYLIGSRSQT